MMVKVLIFAVLCVGAFGNTLKKDDSDRFRAAFRATCRLNDAEDKAPQAEDSFDAFFACMNDVVEFNKVGDELEVATGKGELKSFFNKYCNKAPQLKTCINGLFDGVYPCMSKAVRGDLENSKASVAAYIDSLCQNEAEKPISYLKDGVDCLNEYDGLGKCIKNKRKNLVEKEPDLENIYPFCNRLLYVTSCTIEGLETCVNKAPLEVAREFYYQLKNNTPCKDEKPQSST